MNRNFRLLSLLLAVIFTVQILPLYSVGAELVDMIAPAAEQTAEPTEETVYEVPAEVTEPEEAPDVPEETVPEESVPEAAEDEPVPEETTAEEPAETQPETEERETGETVPAATEETVPEETVPEETLPEEPKPETPVTVHNVPLYFQTDYPDNMFGYGTIASSGCSITSLAMVATYLTGHTYLPDQLARYFGGRAANNMARMEYGATAMQLPFTKNTNWHHTLAALEEGKIAIVLLNEKSVFTDSQHFVVLTGITEDGKVLVNDPYMPNYGKQGLEQGFVDGFAPGYISNGYSGGWVFDPAAMPEEPFLYSEEEEPRPEPRYPDIHLTPEQRHLLAKIIWVEARGESFEGQQAVAEVVFNRMVDPAFPNSLEGVIFAEGQFRSVEFLDTAQPYQTQYEAIEAALYGPYILPIDVFHFATFCANENVWGTIGNHIFCYRG